MGLPTNPYNLPTVDSTQAPAGAVQLTELADATNTALGSVAAAADTSLAVVVQDLSSTDNNVSGLTARIDALEARALQLENYGSAIAPLVWRVGLKIVNTSGHSLAHVINIDGSGQSHPLHLGTMRATGLTKPSSAATGSTTRVPLGFAPVVVGSLASAPAGMPSIRMFTYRSGVNEIYVAFYATHAFKVPYDALHGRTYVVDLTGYDPAVFGGTYTGVGTRSVPPPFVDDYPSITPVTVPMPTDGSMPVMDVTLPVP